MSRSMLISSNSTVSRPGCEGIDVTVAIFLCCFDDLRLQKYDFIFNFRAVVALNLAKAGEDVSF